MDERTAASGGSISLREIERQLDQIISNQEKAAQKAQEREDEAQQKPATQAAMVLDDIRGIGQAEFASSFLTLCLAAFLAGSFLAGKFWRFLK